MILDIICSSEVDTQDELVDKLRQGGLAVTQATISRDIKELELIKIPGKARKSRYAQVNMTSNIAAKYGNIFKESVISLQAARNIIITKTVTGGANSACAFIDQLEYDDILGSIAGDDTIFTLVADEEKAKEVVKKLKNFF